MNTSLGNLFCASLALIAGWAGGLTPSADGVVLCVSGGQVRMETCMDSACSVSPKTPGIEASLRLARGAHTYCVSGCGDCVDLPVGSKAIARTYRTLRTKQCPSFSTGEFLAAGLWEEGRTTNSAVLPAAQREQGSPSSALPVILRI